MEKLSDRTKFRLAVAVYSISLLSIILLTYLYYLKVRFGKPWTVLALIVLAVIGSIAQTRIRKRKRENRRNALELRKAVLQKRFEDRNSEL